MKEKSAEYMFEEKDPELMTNTEKEIFIET